MNLTIRGEKVAVVEFGLGLTLNSIRRICTESNEYSIDWCGRDNSLLITEDNDCICYPYYSTIEIETHGEDAVKLPNFPCDLLKLQELLESAIWCDNIVYCQICEDNIEKPCQHLHLSEILVGWLGCGSLDYDQFSWDEIYKSGIFKIFTYFGAENIKILRTYLERQDYYIHIVDNILSYVMSEATDIKGCLVSETKAWNIHVDHEMKISALWLKSLEKG